jgi:type VII secretion protein EccE
VTAALRHPHDPAAQAPVRRRPAGPSFGPVPLACVVVVEIGLAAAVVLVALDRALLPVAGVVLSLALLVGLLRRRGRWLLRWIVLGVRFRLRTRSRGAEPIGPDTDARLRALRLLAGDVVVARGRDHDGREVGLVGHEGAWSAVLALDPSALDGAGLVVTDGAAPTFPLSALAGTLSDRGVVLDAVSAIWHCRPGTAGPPDESPAVAAYREVLGPLPPVARRDAWLVVRLDPTRCPDAVAERGGGVVGAHRALVGALARIRRVLTEHGTTMRPLDADEVLRAAADTAGVLDVAGADTLALREHWGAVVVGTHGHAAFAVTEWPPGGEPTSLAALTGTAADSTTLALTLGPGTDDEAGEVGLRATVRVMSASPAALEQAGLDLVERGAAIGVGLDPLDGQHAAGVVATLPLGAVP